MISISTAAWFIRELHRKAGSWRTLEEDLSVNRGTLWRIAHDKERATEHVVDALRFHILCEDALDIINIIRREEPETS